MPREKTSAEPSFGFLSTLESPDYGHFGGYLIVSPLGRPLEFHCTSPVQPSRAQAILYGPTLQTYLLGEQISGALLRAARIKPCLILVDTAAMLIARSQANAPMACVESRTCAKADSMAERSTDDEPVTVADSCPSPIIGRFETRIEAGGYGLTLPSGFEGEQSAVAELVMRLSQSIDLAEPFGRIHEAIREAQRIGERAADTHGQAA